MTNNGDDEYGPSTFQQACKVADAEARKRKLRSSTNIVSFPTVKEAGVPSANVLQREYEAVLERRWCDHGLPKSTRDAADYLIREITSKRASPQRLQVWLQGRPAAERAAIVAYIDKKRGK
jgi:hypothetical protein